MSLSVKCLERDQQLGPKSLGIPGLKLLVLQTLVGVRLSVAAAQLPAALAFAQLNRLPHLCAQLIFDPVQD